jgi:hypothetical protein
MFSKIGLKIMKDLTKLINLKKSWLSFKIEFLLFTVSKTILWKKLQVSLFVAQDVHKSK